MADSWQELLRLRLVERNSKESAFASIIEQCTSYNSYYGPYRSRFQRSPIGTANQASQRTQFYFAASSQLRKGDAGRVWFRWRQVRRLPILRQPFSHEPSAVQAALINSLESQISSLRDELANLYKTQGQNAQRLLSMNETLREKEEASRLETESLRKAREEIATLRRKADMHGELMAEKDRTIQVYCEFGLANIDSRLPRFSTTKLVLHCSNSVKLRAGIKPC